MIGRPHIKYFSSVTWHNTPAVVQVEYDILLRQRDDLLDALEELLGCGPPPVQDCDCSECEAIRRAILVTSIAKGDDGPATADTDK
jgi:hypothetical protein